MKTVSKRRERLVPHVINGKTHQVKEPYEVEVPVPPKDWDSIVLNAVMAATCLVVMGAVAWSTVSIGDLLSEAAPLWVSYLVAGVFDLAWITCMATEWLSRYDTNKAKLPKVAGWVALAVSMGAIFTHGNMAGSFWVGVFGAVVSALAKGMWLVVMRHTAKDLDGKARQWVEAETAEVNAQLAMAAVTRQLNRTRARAADELAAIGQPSTLVVERAAEHEQAEHPEQPARPVLAKTEQPTSTPRLAGDEQRASTPSMAELAREQLASGASRPDVVASILQAIPTAKPDSVKAEVRRQAKKLEQDGTGQYL
ncbi:protein transporter Sec31 [Streptomyces sp. NPDC057375]|uniref:protein transporter Sec31 n=1 Tax=Streptomyces sp. NPDC057375 TaxID=3346109 RepID=UPI003636E560